MGAVTRRRRVGMCNCLGSGSWYSWFLLLGHGGLVDVTVLAETVGTRDCFDL